VVEYVNNNKYHFVANCKFTNESVSEKKLENRLTFGEDMGTSLVTCFLTHGVFSNLINNLATEFYNR